MNDAHRKSGYEVATNGEARPGIYQLYGEKSGHGRCDAAWMPVDRAELGDPPARRPARRRAVVALLDSGVREHPWLLERGGEDFVLDAPGWEEARPNAMPKLAKVGDQENFGSHLGHATFIAGIIRRVAPDAQVLSMKVMDDQGKVDEKNVVAALEWLVKYPGTVDVALLAFGRRIEDGDDTTAEAEQTREGIDNLVRRGVRMVISAGNGGTDEPVFPASYARVAGHSTGMVVSVGAGLSATFPEDYSSRGGWVTDWRLAGDIVSTIPLTPGSKEETQGKSTGEGYGKWSGTSFAAAIVAGEFAAQVETVV
ncbi:S8 family peptidase [Phytohabitans sp. LJ34]|uniref:S8 family peptidase n=1 Tax=Phytohabitans sp. LJ34 TaxID=3452217 RepID=UPI003F89804B